MTVGDGIAVAGTMLSLALVIASIVIAVVLEKRR